MIVNLHLDSCLDPNFCLNGGTCELTTTGARCHCTDRYQGDRCDVCFERFQGDGCQECSPRFQEMIVTSALTITMEIPAVSDINV